MSPGQSLQTLYVEGLFLFDEKVIQDGDLYVMENAVPNLENISHNGQIASESKLLNTDICAQVISDSEPDSLEPPGNIDRQQQASARPYRSDTPDSHAVHSPSGPKTVDQDETPLGLDSREHTSDANCEATGRDTEAPPGTNSREHASDAEYASTGGNTHDPDVSYCAAGPARTASLPALQQPTLLESELQPGSQQATHSQHGQQLAADVNSLDCAVVRGCATLAGYCQHEGYSYKVQLGAMAAFMVYMQMCQPVSQVLQAPACTSHMFCLVFTQMTQCHYTCLMRSVSLSEHSLVFMNVQNS